MPKRHNREQHDRDEDDSLQARADDYLRRDGLSFDFDSGREKYDYQLAIGDQHRETLIGGRDRDYFWGLRGNDKLSGGKENDALYILPKQVSVTDTSRGALVSWNTDRDAAAEGSVLVQDVFKADLRQSDFMFVGAPGFVAGIDDVGSHLIFAG